jgi:hypothetical protein
MYGLVLCQFCEEITEKITSFFLSAISTPPFFYPLPLALSKFSKPFNPIWAQLPHLDKEFGLKAVFLIILSV